MKKIKIAFLIDTIDYKMGGTERQLILLLKYLDRSRFEPYLCCFKNSSWLKDHSSLFHIHLFQFTSFLSPINYYSLIKCSKFLRTEGIDIVQTHFRDGNILGIIAAKLAGIKTIVSARRNQGYWHNRRELAILKILNPMVRSILANSKAIRRYVNRVEGVPEDKIEVIYNGVHWSGTAKVSEGDSRGRKTRLDMNNEHPVIINVSNLRPIKGLDLFLKAAQILVSRHPDAVFLIVGHGDEKENLVRLTKNLGIRERVTFLGWRDDVPNILGRCDLAVLSSHSEGLSNSIIEYMAAGLPVVCTDVGGNGELVENSVNGYLTPPNDENGMASAIASIIENPGMARKMAEESRRRARTMFTLEKCIQSTEKYYERLIVRRRLDE